MADVRAEGASRDAICMASRGCWTDVAVSRVVLDSPVAATYAMAEDLP